MQRLLKLMHFGGLVIFPGSFLTFIVISNLLQDASLQNIAFRRQISTETIQLTLPGMWLFALIGIWMGYKRYGLKQRFFPAKAASHQHHYHQRPLLRYHTVYPGNRAGGSIHGTRPTSFGVQ